MKIFMTTVGLATSLCLALTASSPQASISEPPTSSAFAQRVMPAPRPSMSLTGCLYREWDVPARLPNTAEKLEVLQGYVVADARIVGQGSSAPGRVGGTGGRTYKVEGIPDVQLETLVGKRVEIAGRVETDDEDGSRPDRNSLPRDLLDFSDFVASSVREVAGGTACSPKPAVIPIPPR